MFSSVGASQQGNPYFGRNRTLQELGIRCTGPRFAEPTEPIADTVTWGTPSSLTADGWLNVLPEEAEIHPTNSEIRWASELEDAIVAIISHEGEAYQVLLTHEDVTPARWGLSAYGVDVMVTDKTIVISKADTFTPKGKRVLNIYKQGEPGFEKLAQTIKGTVEPFRAQIEEAIE